MVCPVPWKRHRSCYAEEKEEQSVTATLFLINDSKQDGSCLPGGAETGN